MIGGPTGSPSANARQPLTPYHLPITDPTSRSMLTQLETLRGTTAGPLTSSPIECFPPPSSPVDATQAGPSKTQTVLQGTITGPQTYSTNSRSRSGTRPSKSSWSGAENSKKGG